MRAFQRVDPAGGVDCGLGGKTALVAAVEGVALGLHTRKDRLIAARSLCGSGGLGGLFVGEHGPVIGGKIAGGHRSLGAWHLDKVTKMPDSKSCVVASNGTGHVDRHAAVDPARHDRPGKPGLAADLLGHGKDLEAQPVALGPQKARVFGDGVQVEDIGIGGDLTGLMQRLRGADEGGISAAKNVEEHGRPPVSGWVRARKRRRRPARSGP